MVVAGVQFAEVVRALSHQVEDVADDGDIGGNVGRFARILLGGEEALDQEYEGGDDEDDEEKRGRGC